MQWIAPSEKDVAKNTLVEQHLVAAGQIRMSVVEELESVVSANLQRATRLRQSILQKAFAGQLITSEEFTKRQELQL